MKLPQIDLTVKTSAIKACVKQFHIHENNSDKFIYETNFKSETDWIKKQTNPLHLKDFLRF